MLSLFVIIPLIAAALACLIPRTERVAKYLALSGSIVSLLLAYLLLSNPPGTQSLQWFNVAGLSVTITTATAQANLLLLMLVAIVTPLVFTYSMGYMELPSEQRRFYFEMCVFAASMMLFAISASFITLFIAWEILGITSYLLIGFWHYKERAPTAARKAITTILIGDIFMLMGIVIIGVTHAGFDYSLLLSNPITSSTQLALVFILIAAFTKSAQFPFHEWLSDAMEGPTPVSSFLHSSTMVKAGVFLVMVLLPVYSAAGLLPLILVIGIISAILGASNALTERHFKKILAYSTIEDLGLMFIALGLNAVFAAMILFFVQTFYKAALFMSAGSIIRANNEEEDIYKLCCSRNSKPILATALIGALSIAGIFPLSGFLGKSFVESSAMSSNIVVYAVLVLVGLATSIYAFRWLFIPTRNVFDKKLTGKLGYGSVPKTMVIPGVVLAALVVVATFIYYADPSYIGGAAQMQLLGATEIAITNIVAIAGIAVAFYIYKLGHRMHLASTNSMAFAALHNSTIVNGAYLIFAAGIAKIGALAGNLDFAFDRSIYVMSQLFIKSGYYMRRMVDGQTNSYALAFVLGFALMLLLIAFNLIT